MEAADSEKQQRVAKGSSVLRKPFSDLTNLIRESHRRSTSFSQSKKPVPSADSAMYSIGSTQIDRLVNHQFTAPRDQPPLPTPRTPSPVTLNVAQAQKRPYESVRDTKNNKGIPIPRSTGKKKDKSEEISAKPKYPPMVNTINKGKTVVCSSFVDLSKNYEETMIVTPVNYEVNGAEISSKSTSAKFPTSNNKKRSRSSNGSSKKFVLPQDFIDQQRAYFKEIDEYELEIEEANEVSN